MTKFEEEIARALPYAHSFDYSNSTPDFKEVPDEYLEQVAKAAAEVAKRYIEMALDVKHNTNVQNLSGRFMTALEEEDKEKWLKENGITE